ncbi:MAG: PQQ-binding-like beta-propeller repeat protein, partial [Thaumarchaeota archaeon]|nr:PQQ-binding-like beta-propeller repeat protein [Nitrososphaerota archaeon]
KDGTIYIGTGREARFYALNTDGTVKWKFQDK